jgi:hypothetical protein
MLAAGYAIEQCRKAAGALRPRAIRRNQNFSPTISSLFAHNAFACSGSIA